jgi:glycosyltransferase involved in cell wall biosynthesis
MELAFKTITIGGHTGYGNASRLLSDALIRAGVELSEESDIKFNFCMPPDYDAGKYSIGYTPWESTKVPANWIFPMRGVDDLWTTATWVKKVFQDVAPDQDVFVLPHGIEPVWKPKLRTIKRNNIFWFLHMGEPAPRKGGDIFFEAWYKHFRNRKDVGIIFKSVGAPWCRVKDSKGSVIASPIGESNAVSKRVKVLSKVLTQQELLELLYDVHCLVYPSRGEGFGLIPFEAMATGLPTIMPIDGMGDFAELSTLPLVNSKWVKSAEQRIHPGDWMSHDLDEVINQMEQVMANYNHYAQAQFNNTDLIHETYSWDAVASKAIDRIKLFVP